MLTRLVILGGLTALILGLNVLYRRRLAATHDAAERVPSRYRSADGSWVIFSTPTCVNCGAIANHLTAAGFDAVHIVDLTVEPELGAEFNVRTAPTLLRIDPAGAVSERASGAGPSTEMARRYGQVAPAASRHASIT